jgi:LmbE family N-acetylglucosaminyl deacetylase
LSRRRPGQECILLTASIGYSVEMGSAAVLARALPGLVSRYEGPTASCLSVVCVGAHPDDPECGCAGTLALYSELGHHVTVIYLTRGEIGIEGKSMREAAAVRTKECEAACKIIGAKPVFAGQVDGCTELNRTRVRQLQDLLSAEDPEIMFAHWPIDTHVDHVVASACAFRASMALQRPPRCYFYEVNTGDQSLGFSPNLYVDITSVKEKKIEALSAHVSQDGEALWKYHHQAIADFRGQEAGVGAAEAFYHLNRDGGFIRPPGVQ